MQSLEDKFELPNRVEMVTEELLKKEGIYPKYTQQLQRKWLKKRIEQLSSQVLDLDDFLKLYADPVGHFLGNGGNHLATNGNGGNHLATANGGTGYLATSANGATGKREGAERDTSETYRAHARTQLVNMFADLTDEAIEQVLKKHNFHFAPAHKELAHITTRDYHRPGTVWRPLPMLSPVAYAGRSAS